MGDMNEKAPAGQETGAGLNRRTPSGLAFRGFSSSCGSVIS